MIPTFIQIDSVRYRVRVNREDQFDRNVRELVGEVDFSFHVISTSDSSEDALLAGEGGKGKRD